MVGMDVKSIELFVVREGKASNYKFTWMGLIPITIIGHIVVYFFFGRLVLADWLVGRIEWFGLAGVHVDG